MDLWKDYECELKLSNPLTEEDWDSLTDVDMEHTPSVEFTTKHGQTVRYIKERHGRWTFEAPDPETGGIFMLAKCSECGWKNQTIKTKYCPSCGATMDGGNDGPDQ